MTKNQIDYANYKESVRHNKRTERQTDRSIAESKRHNKASEDIGYGNIDLGYANVGLGYSNLGELYRHNSQSELLTSQQLEETTRHNEAIEATEAGKAAASAGKSLGSYIAYLASGGGAKVVEGYNNVMDTLADSVVSSIKKTSANIKQKFGGNKNAKQ